MKKANKKNIIPADEIAPNMDAAEKISGASREVLKALKGNGSLAFLRSGRINLRILSEDIERNQELVKKIADLPDIKLEKALTARVIRREGEVRLEQTLQNIAPLDICRRILIRGGSMVRGKLMSIPDRVSEWCALETDAAKIRERLILELSNALQSISEVPVEKLIKDTLADK